MAKICPITKEKVLYTHCLECGTKHLCRGDTEPGDSKKQQEKERKHYG